MLLGGLLGLSGDEGRGKLRKAPVRRMQPLSRRLPNGTSHLFIQGEAQVAS